MIVSTLTGAPLRIATTPLTWCAIATPRSVPTRTFWRGSARAQRPVPGWGGAVGGAERAAEHRGIGEPVTPGDGADRLPRARSEQVPAAALQSCLAQRQGDRA